MESERCNRKGGNAEGDGQPPASARVLLNQFDNLRISRPGPTFPPPPA